jgi:GC-rich sequence DNA-binding factor
MQCFLIVYPLQFPELEKVEQQFNGLMNQRTRAVEQRRWQDDLDDVELFALVPSQFINTQEDNEDELDEYGRAKSSRNSAASKRRRLEERSSRHILRETSDDITGMSTDDELGEAYAREEREELDEIQRDKINAIIADVQDDFASLLSVKNKFETWKTDFNDDYTKAYGGLSLPGAFEFYVRIELITWNPFLRPVDFDTMRWHTIISEYGASGDHEEHADDSDATILNKVVEKTVCKKIKDMIPNLDVFSSAQMKSARHAFEQVSYYVEDTEPAYKVKQIGLLQMYALRHCLTICCRNYNPAPWTTLLRLLHNTSIWLQPSR